MPKKVISREKVLIGVVFGLALLAFVFTAVPKTAVSFSIVGETVNPGGTEDTGPRLFIGGEHIHHWLIGIVLVSVALLAGFYSNAKGQFGRVMRTLGPVAGYMFGFGIILVLDQLPYIVGVIPFGA